MIELNKVSKVFIKKNSKVVALSDVSIKLPNTGFVALYGENGCGKTTLLNIISTIDEAYTGEVLYNGYNYRGMEDTLRENVISYVFQENKFISDFSVCDNIEVFTEQPQLIEDELNWFDIIEKKAENPGCLSGGQKQRVSLIRGLVKESGILLVDEPTSAMNEAMEKIVFERLKTLSEKQLVLLVSHNISLIKQYVDLILYMDKGQIVSCEENRHEKIKYEENCIIVPEHFSNLNLIDKEYFAETLDNNKEVLIKVSEDNRKTKQLDYSSQEIKKISKRPKISSGLMHKMKKRAVKTNLFLKILFVFVIALFTSLLVFSLAVSEFDGNKFAYDFFEKNIDELIPFIRDSEKEPDEETGLFSTENGKQISSTYGSEVIYLNLYEKGLSLGYGPMEFFSNEIKGVAYFEKRDLFKLACGNFPQNGEALITDFLARSYILGSSNPEYVSFEDIISKGIDVEGLHVNISGIIKTEYETFITQYGNPEKKSQIQNRIQYYFCDLLYSLDYYMSEGNIDFCSHGTEGEYFSVKQDKSTFVHTETLSDEEKKILEEYGYNEQPRVYVNSALAERTSSVIIYLGERYGEDFCIIEGIVEDGESFPTLYLKEDDFAKEKKAYLDAVSSILTDVNSKELLDYLEKCSLVHDSYYSDTISKMCSIVAYSRSVICFMYKTLPVIILLVSTAMIWVLLREDNLLLAFLRIQAKSKCDIIRFEAEKITVCTLLSAVTSTALIFGIQRIVNGYFTKQEMVSIPLVEITWNSVLTGFLITMVIIIVTSVIFIFIKNRQKIRKLL